MLAKNKKHLWPVYLVVFIDMLGFGMIIPVIRDYTQYLVENTPIETSSYATYSGILMASYSFFQFIFAPILGRLSDVYGRKKLLILSVLGNVISYFMWIISHNYWFFLFSRIVSGATGGNISIAQSYIADNTDKEERAKYMGIMGALFGMGFILGPFFGGLLSTVDMTIFNSNVIIYNPFSAIGLGTMVLSGLNIILIIYLMPGATVKDENQSDDGLLLGREEGMPSRKPIYHIASLKLIKNSNLMIIFGAFFIFSLGFVHVEATLAWDLLDRFHLNAKETGYFFAYMGIVMAIIQGLIYRKLVIKNSLHRLAILGAFILSTGLVLMPLGESIMITGGVTVILAFGMGIGNPSLLTLASVVSDETEQGVSMGIMQSLGSLARIIAPLTATWAYDNIAHNSPYLISSGLILISLLVIIKLKIKTPEKEAAK